MASDEEPPVKEPNPSEGGNGDSATELRFGSTESAPSDEEGTPETTDSDQDSETVADSEDDASEDDASEDDAAGEPADDEPASGDSPSSDAPDSDEAEESKSEDTASEDSKDPKDIPALSDRAMRFGAFGCVGLVVFVALVFFILIKSAIDKIDDYGAVASDEESSEANEIEEAPREEVARPPRSIEWATSYPEARQAARIDLRPVVIVFTAEYATESLDVFDGAFRVPDVENYLDRFFQVVHIDLGAQGPEPDPSIALCEVEFLPHVCYVHPETEEKLTEDTKGQLGTAALLRRLGAARAAYEASATGSE